MCEIAWTFTAVTTSSAKPWPIDSSQNARVRSASRAVNSGGPVSSPAAAAAGSGGRPSTVCPSSAGVPRNTRASGQPTTMASRPEPIAVARQPNATIEPATSGTARPPSASPRPTVDSARARLRSNQWMIATLIGK